MSEVTVQDIIKAKEIVRNNGMDCSLPDSKLEIAKNIAKAAGYTVQKAEQAPAAAANTTASQPASTTPNYTPDQIAQALDIATNAGYSVKKANTEPSVKQTPVQSQDSQTTVNTIKSPAKNQEDINYGWIEQAAASML